MDISQIDKFVSYCKREQPQSEEDIRRFFLGVIGFPYDTELLLQAYLFFNIKSLFPNCSKILLFEKALIQDYTNLGKVDFVYLTINNEIFLIETKYIDTQATGKHERTRRNKHRNKVVEQVIDWKEQFRNYWKLSTNQIHCGVFTTDPQVGARARSTDIIAKSISTSELERWQKNYKIIQLEDTNKRDSMIERFVYYCQRKQPQIEEELRRFFRGVIGLSYDKEILLQAYLFFNIKSLFPNCSQLIMFEQAIIKDYTNLGKVNFVYLSKDNDLVLIKTKYINTEATGKHERTRRNKHRNKVLEQVIAWKEQFRDYWKLSINQIHCGVFTTDTQVSDRAKSTDIIAKSISTSELERWQKNYKFYNLEHSNKRDPVEDFCEDIKRVASQIIM